MEAIAQESTMTDPVQPQERGWRRLPLLFGIAGFWLAADFITKHLAAARLEDRSHDLLQLKSVIVRFALAHNPAGAWSMFHFAPGLLRRILFVTVSVLASVLLTVWYMRLPRHERMVRVGIATVLGGALGNLIDRVMVGSVIDFIEISASWGGQRHFWPTFNVADIAIVVGVALMMIQMVGARKTSN